ncbi:MAG: winged helix-turn-helix domain-containing protein [Candidatus Cloacimonas sp.]
MLERNNIVEYLASNPNVLLDIIEEILKSYYEINNNLSNTEAKKQLVEVSKTIDRLENTGISVPDELRNLKSSLLAKSNDSNQTQSNYNILINGLTDLCNKYKLNGALKPKGRKLTSDEGSPIRRGRLTPKNTLIKAIVQVLEEMGNSGYIREIHNKLEDVLANVLNSEDYEIDSSGQVTWHHQVDWVRLDMVKKGILKNDSPRGIWELSENYQKIMEEL